MVRGLDKFKEQFQQFADSYILIGGAACSVAMEESGVEFRVTKDLDLVLCVESLDTNFIQAFWEFVKKGHYLNQLKSGGKRIFYRFSEPEDKDFPEMLELFSRLPDGLKFEGEGILTPIPADLRDFLISIDNDQVDLKNLGYIKESLQEILSKMREFYDLGS